MSSTELKGIVELAGTEVAVSIHYGRSITSWKCFTPNNDKKVKVFNVDTDLLMKNFNKLIIEYRGDQHVRIDPKRLIPKLKYVASATACDRLGIKSLRDFNSYHYELVIKHINDTARFLDMGQRRKK